MTQHADEPLAQHADEPLVKPTEPVQQSVFERFAVAIVFTVFVVFRAVDRVFNKALSNALGRPSYNLIWTNLLWPIAIQIMTLGMICGYIFYLRLRGDRTYNLRFFHPRSELASSMGCVAMYKMALFTLGDQLNAVISAPAGPFVSQPIQSVMTNWVLVWMAIIAFFWIRARYKQVHYVGITLVVLATMVGLSKKFTGSDCKNTTEDPLGPNCLAAYHRPSDDGGEWILLSSGQMILWYSVFLASTIPGAIGNVYKQKVLQEQDVDVFFATWWSGNFQIMWGIVCLPFIFIPFPGQETPKVGDFFSEIGNTLACIGGAAPHGESDATCQTSPPPFVFVILYLLFNLTFNMCMTWLTKKISAGWAQVATVLCLGLCNIFSTQTWIMGSSAEPMTFNDWLSVITVCIALWVYNLEKETTACGKQVAEQSQGSCVADGPGNIRQQLTGSTADGSFTK